MVVTTVVRAANKSQAQVSSPRPFVAVFFGGTAGIGANGVRGLAAAHGRKSRGLRIYIVGRKKAPAEKLVAECRQACPDGQFQFVQTKDLSLLKNVDRVCAEITESERAASATEGHEPKIDFLVQSQGVLSLEGYKETTEGIDFLLSLFFYSRARATDRLLPLLTAGAEPAHIASVMNPQLEGTIVESDLSLRDPKSFSLRKQGAHGATFTTLYMEALATRNPGRLSLIHYYPGFVVTDLANNSPLPWWAKALWALLLPIVKLMAVSDKDCEQFVAFLSNPAVYPARGENTAQASLPKGLSIAKGADGFQGSGVYRVDKDGDILKNKEVTDVYMKRGLADKVYEHTVAVFAAVESGVPFKG